MDVSGWNGWSNAPAAAPPVTGQHQVVNWSARPTAAAAARAGAVAAAAAATGVSRGSPRRPPGQRRPRTGAAAGAGRNLIHRACDVALKEGRPLLLVPRETPLSLINLRNLVTAKEAGATVLPFIPAYYTKPKTVEDLENHFFQKILDHLGLENTISPRWGS